MINNPNIRRDLGQIRVNEFLDAAERSRIGRLARDNGRVTQRDGIVIREAAPADAPALAKLAELDGQPPLTGHVVVGAVRGVIRAAVDMDGRGVADPFVATADVMDLIRRRARQLCAAVGDCVEAARFSPSRLLRQAGVVRHS